MERIARSFRLVKQSYAILMHDKELMVLPLISGLITVIVAVSFFFSFGLRVDDFDSKHRIVLALPTFLFYVVAYTVGLFFQAAMVAGATERMRGGEPTVGSALQAASRRFGSIFMWALVAATVGTLLRAIQDRVGFLGKIVVGLAGAGWSLATFFMVPVLVLEEKTIGESFKQSLGVFKKMWGETFVGGASVGIIAGFAWVALIAVAGVIAMTGAGIVALVVLVGGAIMLMVFFSSMQAIYVASLYRYATDGQAAAGFDADLLRSAFVPKR